MVCFAVTWQRLREALSLELAMLNIQLISFEMQGPNDKGKHSQTQTARMTTARQHLHRLPNQVNHGQICTTGPCLSQDEGGPLYFEKVT